MGGGRMEDRAFRIKRGEKVMILFPKERRLGVEEKGGERGWM